MTGWPQYVMIGLIAASIGMALAKDGEPRTGRWSFWISLLAAAINIGILYAGGFFGAHC
jgi:hypothetical protein